MANTPSTGSKLLVLDIETRPATAYIWRAYDENVGVDQIIEPGGIICFAAKFVGEDEVFFYSDWTHSHSEMLNAAHSLLSSSDAVITYNGDKFDIPKLKGEMVLEGLPPIPPLTSIDVIKAIRKMGFLVNRLAFIGPLLRVGSKVKHEGFTLWTDVLARKEKALVKMEKYNKQDVLLLEKLYLKVRPYITNHPHTGTTKAECGACGSQKTQSRGWRRTKAFRIQRLQCTSCGAWSDGKREAVSAA